MSKSIKLEGSQTDGRTEQSSVTASVCPWHQWCQAKVNSAMSAMSLLLMQQTAAYVVFDHPSFWPLTSDLHHWTLRKKNISKSSMGWLKDREGYSTNSSSSWMCRAATKICVLMATGVPCQPKNLYIFLSGMAAHLKQQANTRLRFDLGCSTGFNRFKDLNKQ